VPPGTRDLVVIVSGCVAGKTVREKDWEAEPEAASVTVTFTVEEPLAVGVPLIPPEEEMPNPAGNPVAENE
jgi:hypothetical protein